MMKSEANHTCCVIGSKNDKLQKQEVCDSACCTGLRGVCMCVWTERSSNPPDVSSAGDCEV